VLGGTTGAGGTPPPPAPPTDIDHAHTALTAAGFTHSQAIDCLQALSEAGFIIHTPQALLRMVDAALEATR
jgi:hypothetical protein